MRTTCRQLAQQVSHVSSKLQMGALVVNAGCALEHLHNSLGAIDLQYLATSACAIAKLEVDNLCILWLLQIYIACVML